jgi:hypothetical protein
MMTKAQHTLCVAVASMSGRCDRHGCIDTRTCGAVAKAAPVSVRRESHGGIDARECGAMAMAASMSVQHDGHGGASEWAAR